MKIWLKTFFNVRCDVGCHHIKPRSLYKSYVTVSFTISQHVRNAPSVTLFLTTKTILWERSASQANIANSYQKSFPWLEAIHKSRKEFVRQLTYDEFLWRKFFAWWREHEWINLAQELFSTFREPKALRLMKPSVVTCYYWRTAPTEVNFRQNEEQINFARP